MPDDGPSHDLPPLLAALWGPRVAPRRGPRPGLSVEQIVEAAVALADADGLEAVSMGRVAASLGVTTMALYRYVGGKDELLALMTDTVIGTADVPDVGPDGAADWREALERWCRAQLDITRAHPWLAALMSGTRGMGPHRLWVLETGLRCVAGTALTHGERTEVIGRLSLTLLSEATLLTAMDAMEQTPDPVHPALVDYDAMLRLLVDPAEQPATAAALEAGAFRLTPDDEYDVDFGLRLMLDGVAALIDRAERRD